MGDFLGTYWPLIGISVSAAVILMAQQRRTSVIGLLLNYLFVAAFLSQQQYIKPDLDLLGFMVSTTVLIKIIAGASAVSILAITALTFSRDYEASALDEFSLAELRRAARQARRLEIVSPRRFADVVVPMWAMVLVAIASFILPRLYPIGSEEVDFAWYWLTLTGFFTIVTASDVLKLGLGLLLCVSSIDLLYTAIASTVQVFPLALLGLTTIVLSLAVSYLSGLMYGRLKTLELNELYKR
ncbi:MAG: hypothetical protein ACO3F2_07280 [Roseiflexaceae bacterium]